MIIKKRTKPLMLQILESLNYRTVLSTSEKKDYYNQLKGYNGELQFDNYLEKLQFDCLVINDLLLTERGKMVQIDALILMGDTIYLYEVKNYSGSYDYKEDGLYAQSDFVITDPLTQIHNSQPLLYNLVRKLGHKMEIRSQVVFIDPNFYLYQLPRDKPFLFAHQLSRYFDYMKKKQTSIKQTNTRLATQLSDLHITNYRPSFLPEYDFSTIKKGTFCPKCFSFEYKNTRNNRLCSSCGHRETITEAIKRSSEEFHRLFPELKVTKHLIYEWCGGMYSEQRIQRVLSSNYVSHGNYKSTYYEVNCPILIK